LNPSQEDHPPESVVEDSVSEPDDLERIRGLPKEVGALLVAAGVGGLVLPGPFGTPLLVLGGLVLWPRAFGRVEKYLRRRFPKVHHEGLRHINRFLDDLDRRYPPPK
jgi:hypothetical protein